MALIRWQPYREIDSLQKDMNRLFEAFAPMEDSTQQYMPLAEMEETEDAIHLMLEVPGMNADDLDVRVTKEAVMISGERKTRLKSSKARSEFRYGKFSRTIPLSTRIDNNKVKGDYQDGILSLELPKIKEEEHKVVKVSLGSGNNQSTPQSQPQADSKQDKTPEINGSAANGGYGNVTDMDIWEEDSSTEQSVNS